MKAHWTELEAEYITTGISYAALARKHNIPVRTIEDAGKRNGWVSKRKQFRGKVVADTQEAIREDAEKQIISAKNATGHILDYIESLLQNADSPSLSPTGIEHLANALSSSVRLIRDFYDIPTPAEREQRQIARERLEIERRKSTPEADHELRIVFAGQDEQLFDEYSN